MISPFLKEEDLVNNIQTAISKGIAKDAAQIGLLETLKDKIAQTFDAFDTTVRRLVRIQDMNTTAARMGMEASLNAFLNGMYETTEYLSDIAASVRSSLEEAEALMSGDNAVAFEYQVQK